MLLTFLLAVASIAAVSTGGYLLGGTGSRTRQIAGLGLTAAGITAWVFSFMPLWVTCG